MAASAQVKWLAMPASLPMSMEKGSNVGVAREQGCLNCCPVQWMKGQKATTMTYIPYPIATTDFEEGDMGDEESPYAEVLDEPCT